MDDLNVSDNSPSRQGPTPPPTGPGEPPGTPAKPARGIIFRNIWFADGLVLRWALFFDYLGVPWVYRGPGPYDLPGFGWHQPDFHIESVFLVRMVGAGGPAPSKRVVPLGPENVLVQGARDVVELDLDVVPDAAAAARAMPRSGVLAGAAGHPAAVAVGEPGDMMFAVMTGPGKGSAALLPGMQKGAPVFLTAHPPVTRAELDRLYFGVLDPAVGRAAARAAEMRRQMDAPGRGGRLVTYNHRKYYASPPPGGS
jgi:hypothetical protein